jgi:hypothetical protein
MLETNVEEINGALGAAKNLNSALKKFLRVEGTSSPQVNAFAKEMRGAVARGRPEVVRTFIEKNFPKREMYFLGVARYAHAEFFESTIGDIFNAYADDFNATYEKGDSGVTVKDEASFTRIVNSVLELIETKLAGASLPSSNFLRNALLISVFEPDVLVEVLKVVKKG